MDKKSTLLPKVLLSLGSTTFFLAVLEIGTRIFWNTEIPGPHVGVVMKEGTRQVTHEGIQYVTNSLGLRNKELPSGKAPGVERILVLGDSFVWGDGLNESELVTSRMEQLLNTESTRPAEVINAGISGYNTRDELIQLRRLTPIYDPDLVILFFFSNDILATGRPDDVEDRKPVSWKQNLKEGLRQHSKFFALLYSVYKGKLAAKVGVPRALLPGDYFDLDDSKPGWTAFKQSVLEIQEYCQQENLGFVFVMIPTLTSLNEHYPYAELRDKVTSFVTAQGIHLIDLFDLYSPFEPSELWVSLENTHWNGKATALAAEEATAYLRHHGL